MLLKGDKCTTDTFFQLWLNAPKISGPIDWQHLEMSKFWFGTKTWKKFYQSFGFGLGQAIIHDYYRT
jgi:hypothetical protein